ncbi:MAG: dihydrolipoamide acetyltransferase family protein [Pigeon pea little leaf phytoplasma]|uniref:2-oxo acid dehydrogenase subunit E2 n=1 Tax=Candidatus Phytoplasma fabacearum TaxID=2982628 RepID=A0ABU8ZSE4_9MOLU|nr:dihydrolipoamide acetyltransferase family protein ['Bituminaria bituminosa' little leaf phytoplasma]MDV3149004.1 dihydrolipoamide acetyltransferase family protein [Pigeon pea little leaf phytoplasma]MDO7983499.1 2-oxo acid dehydrogenase subunit E2 ['Bituminaria bituminosa' little leaf phytoplasma]MDO8023874.1 2-oxo acid dehydrogenase subunit E2 ['Bituminaria bituminosa' little leaf phytoplasma]MDO8030515.1 2-oxo acid dehydrogenase subunit E2 ['Bituminaria bituminosa' little leaf phytoplasma]
MSDLDKKIKDIDEIGIHGSDEIEIHKISRLRKTIANQMSIAKSTIPDVTLMEEFNMNNVVDLRKDLKSQNATSTIKLTYLSFVAKALVKLLRQFPIFNSAFDAQKEEIIIKKYINLGIAVDTDDGLIVPNIKNADTLNIWKIAELIQDLSQRTRNKKLVYEDIKNGTFTLSNWGTFGVSYGTPIIYFPQVAILGMGLMKLKPIVLEDGNIGKAYMLPLSLSFDHRVIDGGLASRFLSSFKDLFNNPSILIE